MDSVPNNQHEFIVVGGGTAGCVVASCLARSASRPKVLLIEAGGSNSSIEDRILCDKYFNMMNERLSTERLTTPQRGYNGRTIDLRRGKGLGGCSANNLCAYTVGPKDDYEEWARIVGDEDFNWKNASRRYNELENYKTDFTDAAYQKYAHPNAKDHGNAGLLNVEFANKWENSLINKMEYFEAAGIDLNKDINSGNPLGIGVVPSTANNGYRQTGASAFLRDSPPNLTCLTDSPATKILFDGNKKAISIRTESKQYYASKDIILCCGALDSPKLLKLSGIGAKEELSQFGIDVVHALPGVGENLRDHMSCSCIVVLRDENDGSGPLYSRPADLDAARKQFLQNGDGPLSLFHQNLIMGFFRHREVFESDEFRNLPDDVRSYMLKDTIPNAEILAHISPSAFGADPNYQYLMLTAIGQVPMSQGTVKLVSEDPRVHPATNPEYLSHPFDQRTMIASIRHIMGILESSTIKSRTLAQGAVPNSFSDADILSFLRENAKTTFHPACTVKMGKDDDVMACLDARFCVRGVHSLRVADLSSLPFLPNCHPQSVAYLIGLTAAEKVIEDHDL